ncbi:MAG: hypothetical protein LQ343_007752 [Gyalolechia ehrenbergii]|nr:MAG: hypothetical protein LQ343_007752 [Gyalolechia ehrenbergii]
MQSPSIAPIAPLVSSNSDTCSPVTSDRPRHNARRSSSTVPSLQRIRKRVPWRGKTCIISLPPPPNTELKKLWYLTRSEVDKRPHEWQAHGYYPGESELDARFSNYFCKSNLQTQTRPPFPDSAEILAEREKRPYRAKIPDRAQWDSYVNDVTEAKLSALGVSLANDDYEVREAPAIVPVNPHTSCRASRVPISPSTAPPIAPNAAKLLLTQPYNIPTRTQDAPCASSYTSPVATYNMQQSSNTIVSHLPMATIAQSQRSEDSASPYHGLPRQSSALQLKESEYHRRISLGSGTSPPTNEAGSRRPSAFSKLEVHSTSEPSSAVRAYSTEDLTAHAMQKQLDGKGQDCYDGRESGNIVSSDMTSVAKRQEQSGNQQDSLLKTVAPDLQYPIPRSRHESISETLERSLDEARNTDPTIQNQSPKTNPLGQSRSTTSDSKIPYTQSPASTSIPQNAKRPPDSQKRAEHQSPSGSGVSGLNALAPEFKSNIAGLSSSSSMACARMRPTAPAFTPIAASQTAPLSREFSFSSTGPSFKPSLILKGTDLPIQRRSADGSNELFSTVTYPSSSKAVKRSRAIPILRPRDGLRTSGLENEVQEDESGRSTRAEGRQKRMRCSNQGTEQVSTNALSSQASSLTREQHPDTDYHKISPLIRDDHIRQDSSSLEKATQAANQLKKIIDDLSASEGSSPPGPPIQDADSYGQASSVHCPTERPAIDDTRLRQTSLSNTSLQEADLQTLHTSWVGSLNEDPVAHGTAHKRVLSSSADSSSRVTIRGHNPQLLADFDPLDSLHQKDSSKPSSNSTTPAPGAKADLHGPQISIPSQEHGSNTQDPAKAIPNGVSYIDSSHQEIDAVLKQLDNEGSGVGMKDNDQPPPSQNTDNVSTLDFYDGHLNSENAVLPHFQDNAQGPRSSRSLSPPYQHLARAESESADSSIIRMIAENARFSPSYRPPYVSNGDPRPLQGTDSVESAATGEWDDAFSSSEEARANGRRSFLDSWVNRVVGNTLQVRLAPLERSLADIKCSLINLSKQSPARSDSLKKTNNADISDADDEDDVQSEHSRTKSPTRYRNTDKFKTLAAQIVTAQQNHIPAHGLASMTNDIKELKAMLQETRPSFTDFKSVVEEVVGKQMRGRSGPITSSHQSATAEKNQLQITGLESMLKIAEGRAEDELKARRATEDALADAQRLLRLSLQDAAEQRESAEETERSLSAFHEERHEVLRRNATLEGTQESLQKAAADLAEKNAALEGTLEEYRLSSAQWRDDIDSVRSENSDLRRTVNALKAKLEDGIRGRQALRTKFDQFQDEMILASQNIAQDQSSWRRKEEQYKARYDVLAANYERENERCKKIETEIAALCKTSRLDKEEHQQVVTAYRREIHNQREATRLEQDRMQETVAHDRKAAMLQLNDLCTRLGNVTANFETQLGQANHVACTESARYEQLLQEAAASKVSALREHQNFHDQVVKGLAEQHQQILKTIGPERQSIETEYSDRLALADEKMLHYRDKIRHLEEQLEIAKSAAQAAVQAIQSKQPTVAHSHQPHASMSGTAPEKISPQALRESILVLQEQLQDREIKIEQLEQKCSTVDMDAPNKLKAQESEIAWLRELFDVRLGELHDLIVALAQPAYDQEAIKGAAIRLKASLEMEQQEKERAQAGGQSTTHFASIASLTSSPRSLPLAAAAAWGNWRKGRNAPVSGDAGVAINSTPSRSSALTQSLSPGLLTPPRSDTGPGGRSSADTRGAVIISSRKRPMSNIPSDIHLGIGEPYEQSPPVTPSLMRTINYDVDAMSTDGAQIHDAVGLMGRENEDEELFGRPIAASPEHL